MKLKGAIPVSIFNLPSLRVLHANENSFSGPLPAAIGQLTNLEELTLNNNELTGQLPTELGRLSLMQILTLTNNAFGGTLPNQALEQMTNLRTLSIQPDNNLGGTVPDDLYRISTLKKLDLGYNAFSGEVKDLPDLKSLWLYSNPVEFTFEDIGKAKKLESLLLGSTRLKSLKGIGDGFSLVEVDVGFNQLSGPIPNEIENLVNLESFIGPVNSFTGTVPAFSILRKLSVIRLGDNKLTGNLPSFSRHPNIKAIDLSENNLDGSIPTDFLDSANVEESLIVDLSDNMLSGYVPGSLSRVQDLTIYLRDNRIGGIDPSLCANDSWNQGDVGSFQCDGILCPGGSYAATGRASNTGSACEPCRRNQYYGSSTCGTSAAVSRRLESTIVVVFAIATTLTTLIF
eukprot:jgi/Psemu1/179328/e_gw1.8.93.1